MSHMIVIWHLYVFRQQLFVSVLLIVVVFDHVPSFISIWLQLNQVKFNFNRKQQNVPTFQSYLVSQFYKFSIISCENGRFHENREENFRRCPKLHVIWIKILFINSSQRVDSTEILCIYSTFSSNMTEITEFLSHIQWHFRWSKCKETQSTGDVFETNQLLYYGRPGHCRKLPENISEPLNHSIYRCIKFNENDFKFKPLSTAHQANTRRFQLLTADQSNKVIKSRKVLSTWLKCFFGICWLYQKS